jgi:hypothetical protein
MIHAELSSMIIEAGGGEALQNYVETYEGEDDFMMIWTYYQTYKPYVKNVNPGWEHEYMADYYIEYIAEGLKKLHPILSSQAFIDYGNSVSCVDGNSENGNVQIGRIDFIISNKTEKTLSEILSLK